MKKIHEDHNGVETFAVLDEGDTDVTGHVYEVKRASGTPLGRLEFQFGAVKENGVNGLTSEALLAILIHRTLMLNARFPSAFNVKALAAMAEAAACFDERTADRLARKVEGEKKA
jgi:hypothetical protein